MLARSFPSALVWQQLVGGLADLVLEGRCRCLLVILPPGCSSNIARIKTDWCLGEWQQLLCESACVFVLFRLRWCGNSGLFFVTPLPRPLTGPTVSLTELSHCTPWRPHGWEWCRRARGSCSLPEAFAGRRVAAPSVCLRVRSQRPQLYTNPLKIYLIKIRTRGALQIHY